MTATANVLSPFIIIIVVLLFAHCHCFVFSVSIYSLCDKTLIFFGCAAVIRPFSFTQHRASVL